MSIQLAVWLFAFIMQASLLGRSMFAMICLSDLEQDFINPYDCSAKLNRFVVAEYAGQLTLAALLVVSGNWFLGAIHVALLAYMVQLYLRKQFHIDATDVFRQLSQHKWRRGILFGVYCFSFVLVTYRVIECVIHSVLTPEGREAAKKLFREAAASVHGY